MKTKSNLILIKILIDIYCDSSIYSHSQSPSTKGTLFLHRKMEAIGFQHCCTFVSVQLDSNTVVHLYRCQSDLIFGFGVKVTQSGLPRIRTQNEGPCCFPPGRLAPSEQVDHFGFA